ncbi:hypothetical protein [Aquimarina sp. 2201CG5-10]|uniref:hypothetical protein n=1 Tax=Aquimarina callyspongiae TaxID=3098150 RepID=UPI002AB3AA33|nr:hypothetical protein [Aquimarina sp. 2201CG5-10]MDY8134120.1 hypothetical protein [Aquimarina sp. 2201CG5-10]
MKKFLTLIVFLTALQVYSQYERGSVDFGLGAIISVGLQEEAGFDIRGQYTSADQITTYIAEYNRYFIKEFENTEVYNELIVTYNVRLLHWEVISITGGIGYVGNDYVVLNRAEDTSNLFFTTGSFNHGAELKFRGLYNITTPIHVFVELNLKSFGRRYDTFAFGLTYSLGI